MSYVGDFRLGKTFDVKFCTVTTTGAPTQLAGSPTVAAYPDNSTTEITAGITLTVDFDGRTGLNNVRVVATGGNGYASGVNYQLVITAGTVGGTSVVGYVVGQFSIEARSALMPTTADRTLDVSAGGESGLDWANIGSPTTTVGLSGTTVKTATDVETDTVDIQARLPAALVSGRIDASIGAMAANVLTASAIAADAITDAKVAADVTIASVTGSVGSVTAAVTVGTNNDKTGYGLSAAAVQAIWDALSAALTTANSIGKRLVDFITGDSFGRLGAPAGASVSADIAAVTTDTTAIKAKTDNLPEGIKKNTALAKFEFFMVLSADHVTGATGKTIDGAVSKDGGAFGALTNTPATEVGNGIYWIDLAAADLNGTVITLRFSEAACDTRFVTIKTTL